MTSCRKRAHIGTDLGHDHFGRKPPNARGRDQSLHRIAERRKHLTDPLIEGGDAAFQFLDQVEVVANKKAMMRRYAPLESRSQIGARSLETRRSQSASLAAFVSPAIIAFRMRRPLTPIISETTVTSLMLASSRVF